MAARSCRSSRENVKQGNKTACANFDEVSPRPAHDDAGDPKNGMDLDMSHAALIAAALALRA
eukprot:CAMPEP_0204212542 /NCGR_PEP_ID=MMETSP0361-20130328/75311_1 /ASSEMBLY_ACC=CAM_ASM_000343 /TAXON_ID=268821 /ORGANISM="Scrippsiella Hangoei, Strain SHTV-5" /LENGTH=61 /DNA_ID=CAMNT_0051176883 /DNA_START=41 /DNA_END=223 /DNA_ORIENTATION=-